MDLEKVVAEFDEKRAEFERCKHKMVGLIEDLLNAQQIPFTQIEGRTKEVQKFRDKIVRPGKAYSDPLVEITDLCGVRIILRRTSDVERVVQLLKSEFIVDEQNSVYKAKQLKVDQFGYSSVHIVVSAKAERGVLPEWSAFAGFKVEIQVRTILQHAWATISRVYDYRAGPDVPHELRRALFRLSALVELADDELDRFASDVQRTIEKYQTSLKAGNKSIELNLDSLRAFIDTSPCVKYWNQRVYSFGLASGNMGDLSRDLRIANFCGVSSFDEIELVLDEAKDWGGEFIKEYLREVSRTYKTPPNYISIDRDFAMVSLLVATHADTFTPEILAKEFGWASTFVLDVARRTVQHKKSS